MNPQGKTRYKPDEASEPIDQDTEREMPINIDGIWGIEMLGAHRPAAGELVLTFTGEVADDTMSGEASDGTFRVQYRATKIAVLP